MKTRNMTAAAVVAFLGFLFLTPLAFADDYFVGIIWAPDGGSINNSATVVDSGVSTFTLPSGGGSTVSVQCDGNAYVRAISTASGSVTASNGVKVTAGQLYDIDMMPSQQWIAVKCVSGNCSCNVFQLRGKR